MKNNFSIILALIFCFSCEHELERNNPLDGLVLGEIEEIDMGANFVVLSGSITTNKITPVSDYGFCWTLEGSIPTFDDPHISNGELVDKEDFVFQSTISGLELNQVYCFRLFAVTSIDTSYSNEFFTSTEWDGESPIINTNSVNLITSNSVTVEGELIELGDPTVYGNISQHGHCWSTIQLPTINDNKSELGTLSSTGTFNTNIESLNTSTAYYCRSYVVNNAGAIYGNSIEFNTTNGEPSITTGVSTNITSTTADIEGEILSIGDATITQHGHCWSTSQNPTTNDNKNQLGSSGVSTFISSLTNLSNETTYYYRSYATNSYGTAYGDEKVFSTTNGEPTVITIGSNNSTSASVTLLGEITGIGDATITQHGHCWSTSQNPTTNDNKNQLGPSGVSTFISSVSGLQPSTTYFYRSYVTNNLGTAYGIQKTFVTTDGRPEVETVGYDINPTPGNTWYVPTDFEGKIISSGDSPITSHGFNYGTSGAGTQQNPTTPIVQNGNFSRTFSLSHNYVYYFRTYATNSFGTSYGEIDSFRTPEYCDITTASTSGATNITTTLDANQTQVTVNFVGWSSSSSNQVDNISLYRNETFIATFGSWLIIYDGERTFNLPSNLDVSDCYTIRVEDGNAGQILMVSNPFTIE